LFPVSTDLFDGLDRAVVDEILAGSEHRRFAAGELLCRESDPADSLLVIESGAAEVLVGPAGRRIRRLRRGDVIGEIALMTGEVRSASVRAVVPVEAVEVRREAVAAMMGPHPQLLMNLSRILSQRLARAHVEHVPAGRGEAVGIVVAQASAAVADLLSAAAAATPKAVTSVVVADDLPPETAARALDDLLAHHGYVFVVTHPDTPDLATLLAQLDRTVAIGVEGLPEAETVDLEDKGVAWTARHITRTKLGLALGAGGAKGYAHVGVLAVLEEAGYTVDFVSGTSIGAIVGACLAMGMSSGELEQVLRERFSPEVVKAVFNLSFSGTSTGYEVMRELTHGLTGERTFADLHIPFVAMAADLNSRLPVPISSGSLAEAILASTALAGLFPPFERDRQRLVDGLALVPVPVASVIESGADITVSVNLMSRETLSAWPGDEPLPTISGGRQRMLETLLEVMDLTQLDASVRHAAQADVTLTPRFGPCTWRDFHLADRFISSGRESASGALDELGKLARPCG